MANDIGFFPMNHKPPLTAPKWYYKPTALHGVCINTTSSETAAAALMPESSKGPRMGKVSLSQLILTAVAKYILSSTYRITRKTGPFGMNEFTVYGDKRGTRILRVPPMFKDSLFKALQMCTHYAQTFLLPRLFTVRFITQLN